MIVVIPAHNESSNIGELIDRIKSSLELARIKADILVVDDDSSDGTAAIASQRGAITIRNLPGSEYGNGFMVGLQYAAGRVSDVVFIDAGLSYLPEDISNLIYDLNHSGADIAIGSRMLHKPYTSPLYVGRWNRKLLSWFLVYFFIPLFAWKRPMDYSSFRAFSASAVTRLYNSGKVMRLWSMRSHAFNPQLLQLLRLDKYRIYETPIHYVVTKSHLSWHSYVEALWAVVSMPLMRVLK